MKDKKLRSELSNPYYIVSPDYTDSSSGIIAMHLLCHALNLMGEEAYMTQYTFDWQQPLSAIRNTVLASHEVVTNDHLRTPVLKITDIEKHKSTGRQPVAVYPEIISGNPLNMDSVVRYILNIPGLLGGDVVFGDNDILFYYRDEFAGSAKSFNKLHLPTCDLSLFNLENTSETNRKGSYFFINRYRGHVPLQEITKNSIEISFRYERTLKELSEIFKSAELLYCYEPSALCFEALLCGCPVVFLPNELLKEIPSFEAFGNTGVAWGSSSEQIEHAKQTAKDFFPMYSKLEEEFWEQLEIFIEKTQKRSKEGLKIQFKRLHDKAVILHLYNTDDWEEINHALSVIPESFDLYISCPADQLKDVTVVTSLVYPDVRIYEVANKGRDILPFLTVFKQIKPLNYKLILKLHSLNHLQDGKGDKEGYQMALRSLAQWNKRVSDIFNLFESNLKLGVFSSFGFLYPLNSTDANFHTINQLIPGFDKATFDKKRFLYARDSMFWFRPKAIEGILKVNLTAERFEEEPGQVDSTFAHAVGKLFGIVCQSSGYTLVDRMPKRDDIEYQQWLEEKRENDLSRKKSFLFDGSRLPKIHCLVCVDNDGLSELANTIDSMGAQDYENWHLSVISHLSCPDEMFYEVSQLSWLQVEQQHDLQTLLINLDVQAEWFGFLEAGDYLEPHALSSCVEYLKKNPEWKVIYSDEDRVSSDGFFHSPRFKPDFNLDFFYSVGYIGGFVLFKMESLNELDGIKFLPPVLSDDLVLNYLDLFGKHVIGHIENILMHRQDSIDELILSQSGIRQHVLSEHFVRNNSEAIIEPGFQPGSFYIKFPVKQQVLVSIIISTNNELKFLRQCIDSIFEKTTYDNYELIIVDNQGEDPELLSYLNDLDENESRIKLISHSQKLNYAEINNLAVEQAAGSHLLLLNNDTVVLQDEWLQGMLSNMQRNNVGAVGVRLVSPHKRIEHAGFILGMGVEGIARQAHAGLPMNETGYMGRAMAMQEFSAVSSACLMIEKKLYQNISGMDEGLSNVLFSDVDLCLKLGEQGYKIVWVPYVTLIHHGLRYYKKVKKNNKKLHSPEKEIDSMMGKWLSQLSNDSAYNGNLSLKTAGFTVDRSLNVSWNIDFKEKPKVYAFPPDSAGVGEYRVRGPVNTLARAGLIEGAFANNVNELILPTPVEIERIKPDVLFMQNGFLEFILTAWKKYRKFNDMFMVCGQDDIVYMLPESHPMKGEWPTNLRRKVKEQFQCSDRLIVANEALAKEFETMADDIVVVPNYLENIRWDSLLLPENNRSKKLRVGWAGGHQHVSDLQFILPIVEALHKEVDWVFMGLCLEELEPFVKEIHKGVTFDLYPQKLAELNLDLAIAPLMHNKFNECKTNLRLLEYGVLGWPVVCSDVLPYQNAPVTRVANNTQHWIKTIRGKINEPDALVLEGEILKKWVLDNYMLDDHVDEWYAALMP